MVLTRKKLIFILIICLIVVFICMYKDAQYNEIKENDIISTNGTPVSSYTVILDAGHGEPDRSELYLIAESRKKVLILKLF